MPVRRRNVNKRVFVKVARAREWGGLGERWDSSDVCPTLNVFDNNGDCRAVVLVLKGRAN